MLLIFKSGQLVKVKVLKSHVYGGVFGFLVEEYPENPDDNGPINHENSLKTTLIMHSNSVTSFPIVISRQMLSSIK